MSQITMSIPQFMECYKFRNYKRINIEDSIVKKIVKEDKIRKITAFVIGSLLYVESAVREVSSCNQLDSVAVFSPNSAVKALSKIDTAGSSLLSVVRTIGYWICIIMCLIEILRSLMNGDTKSVSKVSIKYIMAFAALYLLPFLFDLIKGIFG